MCAGEGKSAQAAYAPRVAEARACCAVGCVSIPKRTVRIVAVVVCPVETEGTVSRGGVRVLPTSRICARQDAQASKAIRKTVVRVQTFVQSRMRVWRVSAVWLVTRARPNAAAFVQISSPISRIVGRVGMLVRRARSVVAEPVRIVAQVANVPAGNLVALVCAKFVRRVAGRSHRFLRQER